MVSFNVKAMGGAAAICLLAQQCQCPPVAVPLFISAAASVAAAVGSAGAEIAGAVIAAEEEKRSVRFSNTTTTTKRQDTTAPAGVPQEEFDRCTEDLAQDTVALNVQGPVNNNGVQVDGLPASCMNLATVLDGDAVGGPVPIACGSACLLYDNLSAEDFETMRTTFEDAKNA